MKNANQLLAAIRQAVDECPSPEDGAEAVACLARIIEILESPAAIAVEHGISIPDQADGESRQAGDK